MACRSVLRGWGRGCGGMRGCCDGDWGLGFEGREGMVLLCLFAPLSRLVLSIWFDFWGGVRWVLDGEGLTDFDRDKDKTEEVRKRLGEGL